MTDNSYTEMDDKAVDQLANATKPEDISCVTHNNTLINTGLGDMATRATFLALFIIFGFVGNCVLLATLAQRHRLKSSALNLFMISIAVVNVLDCIANMPLILGATISQRWDYGPVLCNVNSFGVQFTSITMFLGLTLMALDRCIAVSSQSSYMELLSTCRVSILVVCSWVVGLAFSVPLAADVISSEAFPSRYLCSVARCTTLIYITLLSIFCYFLPVIAIIVFYIVILRITHLARKKQKEVIKHQNYTEGTLNPSRIFTEINTSKYVAVLILLWAVFQGPYLLFSFIEQCRNSREFKDSKVSIDFSYPSQLDLAFTWMKLSYPIYFPIITFCWQKDAWQKFKNWILCRKSNLINDASPHNSPKHQQTDLSRLENGKSKENGLTNGGFNNVPVLFATQNGLHIAGDKKGDSASEDEDTEKDISGKTVDGFMTGRKCDVYGSQDLLQLDDGDTSDYDSQGEIDPFSNSNPISVRTEYQRTMSQSLTKVAKASRSRENSENADSENLKDNNATTEKTDSGVESTTNTQEKKRRRHKSQNKVEEIKDEPIVECENEFHGRVEQNDSGRGSVEGNSSAEKRKKKKRPKIDTTQGVDNIGSDDVNVPVEQSIEQNRVETFEAGHEEKSEKKQKDKKKKKKKKERKENEFEERTDVEEFQQVKPESQTVSSQAQRPPLRLEPLARKLSDCKREQDYMVPTPMPRPSKLPNLASDNSQKTSKTPNSERVINVAETSNDDHFTCRSRSESESSNSAQEKVKNATKQRPRPAPRTSLAQDGGLSQNEPKSPAHLAPNKDYRRQQSTTESQRGLLDSSATSTDLSEAKDIAFETAKSKKKRKKAKSEAVAVQNSNSQHNLLPNMSP